MNTTLTAWELALLFGALEQPMPPSVEAIVRGASQEEAVTRLTAARTTLTSRDDFAESEGSVSLGEPLQSLLTACVAADMTVVCEAEDGITAVLYLGETYMIGVREIDGLFSLELARGPEESAAMLLESLGEQSTSSPGQPFSARLSAEEAGQMIISAEERSAIANADDAQADMRAVFEQVSENAPLVKATAVRQGHDGVLVTRLRRGPLGAWAISVVAAPDTDMVTVGWYPEDELLEAVTALPELAPAS